MRPDASQAERVDPNVFRIRNVGRRLGENSVWIDALDIPRGKVVVIVGASGSGKSSVLHLLGALAVPDYRQNVNSRGVPSQEPKLEVSFSSQGQPVTFDLCKAQPTNEFQSRVGFVFQSAYLLQSASASANMALGAFSARRSVKPDTLLQIANVLSIDPRLFAERTSARSGGERQRIALARAFARAPNLILADEPTASLDPTRAEEIIGYLGQWTDRAADRTTIWATHDVYLAATFSDFVIVVRDGRLADWASWPQPNPGDPAILRRWIDGDSWIDVCHEHVGLGDQANDLRNSRRVPGRALPISVPMTLASGGARLRFWAGIGVAQVFDNTHSRKPAPPPKVFESQNSSAEPLSTGRRPPLESGAIRLWRGFGAKAAVARLALFVTLMIVLQAELDGLALNIRNSLLSPTLNPVIVSSRATIDDGAIAEARRTLAIEREGKAELPEAFGRYEFGSRRVALLRDDVLPQNPREHCRVPQNRRDKEVLLDVAALDPAERVLERLSFTKRGNSPPSPDRIQERDDGLWSIALSREAQRKLAAVLGASSDVRFVCLEIRSIWMAAEIAGMFDEATRGRYAPYDAIMSATQWRDFGTARDRDYYQSAAVYFDVDPARSREFIDTVRTRAAEISDPPNTRLVQSLVNEAAFERISSALERSKFSHIIVGFLGAVAFAMLILVLWSFISENFQSNMKSICVALALGAGFAEIATVQLTRTVLVIVPTMILTGLAIVCVQQYQLKYSADPVAESVWSAHLAVERFDLILVAFVAAVLILTLGFSAMWLWYIRRRSLADQLKELD